MNPLFVQSRAILIGLWLLCALPACSPQYNWRTVPNPDVGYTATFPDKPAQVTRELDLIGLTVSLTLQAARVEGAYFSVGTVPLQGDVQARSGALRDALALALANNISAGKPELKQITWLGKPTHEMSIAGTLPTGGEAFAHARFFEHQGFLYQVLIVGPGQQANPDVLTTWLGGFSLLGL